MRYPNYTDPRAYQYFSCGFVGSGHGDVMSHECAKDREKQTACSLCVRGGTARSSSSTSFDNMCGIAPTATISNDRDCHYCAYCGNRAHTLQDKQFRVVGYTCSCSAACDEREWVVKRDEMHRRHLQEKAALRKEAPKQRKEVLHQMWQNEYNRVFKEIDERARSSQLAKVGIVLHNDPTAD